MKYVDDYRAPERAHHLASQLAEAATQPWTIMEVCGGQTHAIVRFGIDRLLPPGLRLVHGPGCPVCVTPMEVIDRAIALARRPDVILCSFGDMLRVPGTDGSLSGARAEGADVRVMFSPLDALAIAADHPDRQVVLLAVGFETTAPAHALTVKRAAMEGLDNLSLLVAHVLVPPALEAICSHPDNEVQGFLAAGHVCTVMGTEAYGPVAEQHKVPIVVTGFEPVDILEGLLLCVRQLERGEHRVETAYRRSVRDDGNPSAQGLIEEVFTVSDRRWRGLGDLPRSGLRLRPPYDRFDAEVRFGAVELGEDAVGECIAGEVLLGHKRPTDCPAFGTRCHPGAPLGAPMVSSEGACAAYFRYRGAA
jgi:hydrogenase expression/formation protein HypD